MSEGSLNFALDVYNDFYDYYEGIYVQESFYLAGYHAVRAIGWGTIPEAIAAGKPYDESHYWICVNSWGDDWGEDGYFKIRFDAEIGYISTSVKASLINESSRDFDIYSKALIGFSLTFMSLLWLYD
jgi:C1A family cysteine protease